MRQPKLVLSVLLLTLTAALAQAQTAAPTPAQTPQTPQAPQTPAQPKQPSPEDMKKMMDATMGAMVPLMGRMTEVMIEAQLKIAEQPATAERIAAFKKNLYSALIKQGFSPAQALQLTIATSLPAATPMGK